MALSRRDFFKTSTILGGTILGVSKKSFAEETEQSIADNWGILNDSTLCIGCRGCQSACKKEHGLDRVGNDPRYDMPTDLNADNLTLIQLYNKTETEYCFIRRSCLHCNYPSCVSVCPVAAFTKRDDGVVVYDKDKCIGCRYCQVACPFEAPTFEYDEAFPVVHKCDFCKDTRLDKGLKPACASVCPRGAIKFGKRGELLEEARNRIKDNPERYNAHIYGETEIGGTSVMFLAPKNIEFEELGYHSWGETPPGALQEKIQHGIFKYWIPPVALYGALAILAVSNRKKNNDDNQSEEAGNES